jgi:hypothetical protein
VIEKEGSGTLERVELDGRRIEGAYLSHADLLAAEELTFVLSAD